MMTEDKVKRDKLISVVDEYIRLQQKYKKMDLPDGSFPLSIIDWVYFNEMSLERLKKVKESLSKSLITKDHFLGYERIIRNCCPIEPRKFFERSQKSGIKYLLSY